MSDTISGTVEDEGTAVSDATVYVIRTDTDPSTLEGEAVTDANGEYSISGLPGGTYHVAAEWIDNGAYRNSLSKPGIPVVIGTEADQKLSHRWYLSEDSGPFVDQIGNADGTNNGTTQVTGDWVDGATRDGDGSSYINVGNLDALSGTSLDDFAIAFSFQTTDSEVAFAGASIGGDQNIEIGLGQTSGSDPGALTFRIDDQDNNQMQYYTAAEYNDGNPHRGVISKDGNSASGLDIYVDQSAANVTNSVDQGASNWADWMLDWYWFARNNEGTAENYSDAVLDDLSVFGNSLTSGEATSYDNPWD